MKKFICGVLCGAILCGTITFAAQYIANPVDFKILVNGEEFISDPPALEVDGSTYLPLRAMGNALGVPVNWNNDLYQVEVGNSAEVAQSDEYSRQNPAPLNTVQKMDYKDYVNEYSVAVRVIETKRGAAAWQMIELANQFNANADAGYEYVLAKIAVSALSVKDDKSIDINTYKFECFSSNNEKYSSKIVVCPKPELSTQLFAGGNTEGYVVFQVKQDDPTPKIAYGMKYDGSGGIWFALQ